MYLRLSFFIFFLLIAFFGAAHAAPCLAAILAEAAVRAGVFFEKQPVFHLFYYNTPDEGRTRFLK